jgi:hypothetical protein
MMRKPLSCPECGRTETDEPVGGMLTAGLSGALIGGLDPHHCGGCWDVVNASDCALPHVDNKPIPRPEAQAEQVATA